MTRSPSDLSEPPAGLDAGAPAPRRREPGNGSAARLGPPFEILDRAAFEAKLGDRMRGAGSGRGGVLAVYTVGIQHEPFAAQGGVAGDVKQETFTREVLATLLETAASQCAEPTCATPGAEAFGCALDRARFCIAVSSLTSRDAALALGEAMCDRMSHPVPIGGVPMRLRAEVGIANVPERGITSPADLIARAGTAMICAADTGTCAPQVYGASMDPWRAQHDELERDLAGGLDRGELVVHYQPRALTKTREIVAMEALVRWRHPKFGLVPPAEFIPIAERTGLIRKLGDFVLRRALRQLEAWDAAGYGGLRVGVNVSAVQFRDAGLFEKIDAAVSESGIDPRRLELELTEGILMRDPKAAMHILTKLRDIGVQLSIDDFGTGYSSLSYLRRFPVTAMKIDQSFIRQVTNNSQDAAITTAVIVLGRSLDLTVVAEGVETESQLAFLRVLECDEVQGFLLGRPAEPEVAVANVPKRA